MTACSETSPCLTSDDCWLDGRHTRLVKWYHSKLEITEKYKSKTTSISMLQKVMRGHVAKKRFCKSFERMLSDPQLRQRHVANSLKRIEDRLSRLEGPTRGTDDSSDSDGACEYEDGVFKAEWRKRKADFKKQLHENMLQNRAGQPLNIVHTSSPIRNFDDADHLFATRGASPSSRAHPRRASLSTLDTTFLE